MQDVTNSADLTCAINYRVRALVEALRWCCDALAYDISVRDDETAAVVLEVGRAIVADDDARFAFGAPGWAREVRRLRELAALVGPAGSVSPGIIEGFARAYRREARERLGLAVTWN